MSKLSVPGHAIARDQPPHQHGHERDQKPVFMPVLPGQAKPVPRDLAVIVRDVVIVRILAQRARHFDGLLAAVTAARS